MSGDRGWAPGLESTATVDFGTTRDGFSQLRRRWMAVDAHAAALIVHGLGEHSGRYEHVGRQLRDGGVSSVGYDHRGFGESGGARGHVDRFVRYLDDLEDQLAQVRTLGLPVVMIGHSLGGLIAASYAVSGRPQPDRLVLSAPALEVEAPWLTRQLAGGLARLAPRRQIRPGFGSADLATDPRVGTEYENDPLVHRTLSLRLGSEMLSQTDWVRARHERLRVATLVLHGMDDSMVPPSASEAFGLLPGVHRRTYRGLKHELFNEPSGPEIIDEVLAWLAR